MKPCNRILRYFLTLVLCANDISFQVIKVNVTPPVGTMINQLNARALANELLDIPGVWRRGLAAFTSRPSDDLTKKTITLKSWFSLTILQSLFPSKNPEEKRKTSKLPSVIVSVTCE